MVRASVLTDDRFRVRCYRSALPALTALIVAIVVVSVSASPAWTPADAASIQGKVLDPLGARVTAATVGLLRDGRRIADTSSDAHGEFTFPRVAEGRYRLEVTAAGFEPLTTDAIFVGAAAHVAIEVPLQIGLVEQRVVVTAAATELPQSRVGAPVTIIDRDTLQRLGQVDVLEALRLVPGVSVVQTGARGGTTSLFVRGGSSNSNKVLIDGVPANDIGGAFDFSNVATAGVDRVEVLRGPNSVLYGSDAIAGVVSLTTPRGRARTPEWSASLEGGTLSTFRQLASIGGAIARFDYFAELAHFGTDNHLPNNASHNKTVAGRFGVALGAATDLSATVRRVSSSYGSPNAIDFYGIADDSSQTAKNTYVGLTAQSQITSRWQSTVRLASAEQHYQQVNPSPTGQPFDPFGFGANYLGQPITIVGANGFTTSGRAILDYGGSYPSAYDASTSRRSLFGQTSVRVLDDLDVAGGVRVEHEEGVTLSGVRSATDRTNVGSFLEARAALLHRLHVTAGLGFEHNAIFGAAVTPRLSIAAYLRQPSSASPLGDTKVTFNAGKGIKEPSVSQELSSLFTLLQALPPASAPISSAAVSPIGPERNRSLDVGIEQGFWQGRVRLRTAYFDNAFSDLIEFVSKSVLPQLGIPPAAAAATASGAYVNSQSNHARGLETSADARVGRLVRLTASYTYLDAVVTKSFASGALKPAINPAFPGIPIGAYSPLVGAQPFRRPPHSGSVMARVAQGPVAVAVAGYFTGKSDDSTFLLDGLFGSSLLLPNHDLDAGYQKVDVSGSYRMHSRLRWSATIENVLNQRYEAAAGFRALPRTIRAGVTVTLGGDPRDRMQMP